MKDMRRLLRLLGGEWGWALAGVVLSAGVGLANAGLLALSGWFIAAMALAGHGGPMIEYFTPAAAIRGLALIRAVGRYLERLVTHDATFRQLTGLRVWFYESLEPLAPAALRGQRSGDLLSRIRADIDRLETFYLRVLVPGLAALIAVPLMMLFLAGFSLGAALVNLAGLVLAGLAVPLLAQRGASMAGERAVSLRGRLSADLTDLTRGFSELLVDGALPRQAERCLRGGAVLIETQRHGARVAALGGAASGLISSLTLWVALIVVLPAVAAGRLSGPDLAMLGLLVLASFELVGSLPAACQALGESLAAARRIFEIADMPPVIGEPARHAAAPVRFDIRVAHLRMRYGEESPWVLDDVNFTIPEGSSLGITGPSGAGKSSLLNILLRFWDFQDGAVDIGGVGVRELSGETVRGMCAVVAQRTHLFNTSIRENLLIARPDADDERLYAVLRDAALLDEVMAMPGGLDAPVGEAGNLISGGQARRLAIARAFLKDAPLLLLDEPTEGLDTYSERAVLAAIARLMRGRTCLLVSHRAQPLRLTTRRLVLEPSALA
ncbi:thiol reductant ABC exporter subunit CydC [Acidocella sp.]|uniref:thiol reductant ABC exporter subunit CydC n=1 Tax=Acidocella sp. TaxID=50710 RepID=UPI003CFF3395